MQQRILQMLRELVGVVVHQAVAKGCNELIAGVVGADDPLAHGQGFHGGGRHHITGAGVHKHLQQQQPRQPSPTSLGS